MSFPAEVWGIGSVWFASVESAEAWARISVARERVNGACWEGVSLGTVGCVLHVSGSAVSLAVSSESEAGTCASGCRKLSAGKSPSCK